MATATKPVILDETGNRIAAAIEQIPVSNAHITSQVASENGVHGLRFYQGKLEEYNSSEEQWEEIETGGGHVIVDAQGNLMPQRSKLKFLKTTIADDEENDVTIVGGTNKTIYGFHLDMTESNPASMISYQVKYEGENVKNYDYTPAAVNLSTGVMNPGDWNLTDDFFIPRSCMLKYDGTVDYYLDEDDETKKEDGTTASDVANTSYGGNAMMEWGRDGRKIWLKIVPDSTPTAGATFYIANERVDNDFHAWNFYDCDGAEIDHFYTPKYMGSTVSGKMRSMSGLAPTTSTTAAQEITNANANNVNGKTEWYTEVWADRTLINILLLMIGKSCNTQAVFGQGRTDGGTSSSPNQMASGALNKKGQWYGDSSNGGVKVFGMEHWWGNVWRRTAGLVNISGTVKYKLTYSTADGTASAGYSDAGTGYKTVSNGTPGGTNGGYVNVAVFNADGIFSKTASGSETTYFCDGFWFNNSQSDYALVGGGSGDGSRCGALCVGLSCAASYATWDIGAALSCKPLAA